MKHARPTEEPQAGWRERAERGFRALDDRLPVAGGGQALLRKAFPEHWSFLLGELALYSLLVLLLTGIFLTLFFNPAMTEVRYAGPYEPLRGQLVSQAYASTLKISFEVRGGLLVRQVHHWAALVFLSAIGVHMLRVFFTGAFRKPREVNWLVGVTLFVLALAEGFTGYSLPDDLLSGTGLRIAQGIMLSIPLVGTYVSMFAFGGEFPGHDIIPRLYPVHILLVPGLLLGLVALHLLLVVVLKHTHWAGPGRTNKNVVGHPMFPQFAARSTGLFLLVAGTLFLLGAVGQINPVWDYGPYSPAQVSTAAQPDWYVGFLEGALRLVPPFETALFGHTLMWNVLLPAMVLPALLFLGLYAYPFFERWVTGEDETPHLADRPRNRPTRTGLGAAGVTFFGVLLAAGGNDVLADTFGVSLNGLTWAFRALLVLGPPVAFLLAKHLCLALQRGDVRQVTEGRETGRVSQSVEGTFRAEHRALPPGERYTRAAQHFPRPVPPRITGVGGKPGPAGKARQDHAERLRWALSRWYYRDSPPPEWKAIGHQRRERGPRGETALSRPSARAGRRIRPRRRR